MKYSFNRKLGHLESYLGKELLSVYLIYMDSEINNGRCFCSYIVHNYVAWSWLEDFIVLNYNCGAVTPLPCLYDLISPPFRIFTILYNKNIQNRHFCSFLKIVNFIKISLTTILVLKHTKYISVSFW